MITKLNEWFDGLPEPRRLLTMIGLILPGIILVSITPREFNATDAVGVFWLFFLGLVRLRYLGGKHDG